MFPCWNQQLRIQFLIAFNPHLCQSLLMMNRNLKFPKYSTPRLTTTIVPASYWILSVGQGMRVLTKKPPGYSLQNSDMLPNLSRTSTLHTWSSPALCQVFPDSDFATFWVSSFFEDHTCYLCSNHSAHSIYCRVISTSPDASGSTSGTLSGTTSGTTSRFLSGSFPFPLTPLLLCLLTTSSDSSSPSSFPISWILRKCSPRVKRSITSTMTLVFD